jgi:cytochrome c556
MKKTTKYLAGLGIVLGAAMFAVTGGVNAAGHLNKIKQRQDAMKAVGGGIKVLVGTAKGEMAFDAAAIQKAAMTIKVNLERAQKLFPEGTGEDAGMENRAKPEIWLDEEGFASSFKKGIAAAENMAKVGDKAALMPALGQLGGACKGCHEKFRAPKK